MFSLVEPLVVIAIIAVLSALLMPTHIRARESARSILRHTSDAELQWAAVEGLREVAGDYETIVLLVQKLRSEDETLSGTAGAGLLRLHEEGVFPQVLIRRADADAVSLLADVIHFAARTTLQLVSLGAIGEIGGDAAEEALATAMIEGGWLIKRYAAQALHGMGLETDPLLAEEAGGWPMWRYSPDRSAASPHQLPEELHLQWVRELPPPRRAWPHQWDDRGKLDFDVSFSPAAAGGRIFVPSSASDSVTAYRIEDGSELWRFYADGPVRLAPALWRGRVFFTSDDGYLYCVDAEGGDLRWKFRGGPSDHRLLGNERIINTWAARGGPVVEDGTVYFAAGVFPLHGVFIHALDAGAGEAVWVNDATSSDYVALPHGGADGYGGLSPQGYLAAGGDRLIVSAGRGQSPVHLDRATGEVIEKRFRGAKGGGNYAVHAVDGGGAGYRTNSMLRARAESVADQIGGEVYIETDRVGGGFRSRNVRDDPDATNVFYKLAAGDRLFLTTEDGRLYCFGPEEVEPIRYTCSSGPLQPRTGVWGDVAESLLEEQGAGGGYGLVLGAGSGDLLRELLVRSELHIVVVEKDADIVLKLRNELAAAGMYGRRAAVIECAPAEFSVQPYLFSLVVSEDAAGAGIAPEATAMKPILELLMPYSGIAWLGAPDADTAAEIAAACAAAGVDRVSVRAGEDHIYAERGGPLTGAGRWTHQYHDAANTLASLDELVRLPLGVLWFGGPNNHDILPRHGTGPRPQVAGGRQVYLGVETISARCVYTGRRLWKREFAGIGHPFTNLELEERWREGREVFMSCIPGVTYIGSPFVTLADGIYLRYEGAVYRLDPATGETVAEFELPGSSVQELYGEGVPDWGHISVLDDYLIATSEPHIFEDRKPGRRGSYSGTSSGRIAVMNRHCGELYWELSANTGFRHGAIISSGDTLYIIDGLSEKARSFLERRGKKPDAGSVIKALNIGTGEELWSSDEEVFGTFLIYAQEHDILVEGGIQGILTHGAWRGGQLEDEPHAGRTAGRRGTDGRVIWNGAGLHLPAALLGKMLVPGRPGPAVSLVTGKRWMREQPHTGERSVWSHRRRYGCDTLNASKHLLLFRTGYAGYFDLEHDSGTGNFSGFRSGCTASMIAADGVLSALDYTRTCTCSYALQAPLALVHMPEDPNIEFWTRYDAASPDPTGHGINFGAPGRRVHDSGIIWHERSGAHRRHPSAISGDEGIKWVAASGKEIDGKLEIKDLLDAAYTVTLHFAELRHETGPGDRVFDVLIDDEKVLGDFDIAGYAGDVLKPAVRQFDVEVSGGTITIELRRSEGSVLNPLICGVEVRTGIESW